MGHPGTAGKDFALGAPKAQDNCLATHLRNRLFWTWSWHWLLYYICLFERKPKKLSLKELHRSAARPVLPSQVGFLLGMAVTPIPSKNLPFWLKQNIEKVIWFYFTHCLTSKTEFFFPLCISDAAESVLVKNTCTRVHTHMHIQPHVGACTPTTCTHFCSQSCVVLLSCMLWQR